VFFPYSITLKLAPRFDKGTRKNEKCRIIYRGINSRVLQLRHKKTAPNKLFRAAVG
jgi:hypothetical protein